MTEKRDCPGCERARNSTMDFVFCSECGTPSSNGKTFNPEDCGKLCLQGEPIKDRVSKNKKGG